MKLVYIIALVGAIVFASCATLDFNLIAELNSNSQAIVCNDQKNELIITAHNGLIVFKDIESDNEVGRIASKFPFSHVSAIDVSDDSKYLAVASSHIKGMERSIVTIYDYASKKGLYELDGHGNTTYRLDFSPDSKYLATCGDDNRVYVWIFKQGVMELIKTIKTRSDNNTALQFSPNGKYLAIGGGQFTEVELYSVDSWEQIWVKEYNFKGGLTDLEFSNDSEDIGICCIALPVFVINVADGDINCSPLINKEVQFSIAYNKQYNLFATAGFNTIYLWNAEKTPYKNIHRNELIQKYLLEEQDIKSICFLPDGKSLALSDNNGRIYSLYYFNKVTDTLTIIKQ